MNYDTEAEMEVLGSAIVNPVALVEVLSVLDSDDFAGPPHRKVYAELKHLADNGNLVSELVMADRLGDKRLVVDLVSGASGMAHTARAAALIVRRLSCERQLRALAEIDLDDVDAGVERALDLLERIASADRTPTLIADALSQDIPRLEETPRFAPTGVSILDDKIGGFHPGQFVVVAGRPGSGKTSLLLQFAIETAKTRPVLFFTLEMPREECIWRLVSWETGIPVERIGRHDLTEQDWTHIIKAQQRLAPSHLIFEDSPRATMTSIRTACQRVKMSRGDLGLVVVDYLQLIEGKGEEYERLSQISRRAKLLARELDVPLVMGAQLNRKLEERKEKKPNLGDLRGSGAMEQDADLVLFAHRPCLYDDTRSATEAELIVAKQRNGPTGGLALTFQPTTTRFVTNFGRL